MSQSGACTWQNVGLKVKGYLDLPSSTCSQRFKYPPHQKMPQGQPQARGKWGLSKRVIYGCVSKWAASGGWFSCCSCRNHPKVDFPIWRHPLIVLHCGVRRVLGCRFGKLRLARIVDSFYPRRPQTDRPKSELSSPATHSIGAETPAASL